MPVFFLSLFRGDPNFSRYLVLGRIIFSQQCLLLFRICIAYAAEPESQLP